MGNVIDLTGQRFGMLTVIERVGNNKRGLALWKCKCDCGNESIVLSRNLLRGSTKSCGCLKNKRHEMIGKKFGKLTVLNEIGIENHKRMWDCLCDCGNHKKVSTAHLINGSVKSCGCLVHETSYRHGLSHNPIYKTLSAMKQRCYNPNNPEYKNYGARGITICEEWIDKEHGAERFVEWSIKNGYKKGLSIDRINNNGNYEPSNCRWTTANIQMFNRRKPKNKLGVVGVKQDKGRFYPSIKVNRKTLCLGGYATIEEAVDARKQAELKYYGQIINR